MTCRRVADLTSRTELEAAEAAGNRQVVGTLTFWVLSFVFACCAAALVAAGYWILGSPWEKDVLAFAAVAGWGVSSAGWYIVVRGFAAVPERMLAYFGAGMLTKLVLLGLTVLLVRVLDVASLEEFFVPFAAVFFLTGFAQLFIAVKGATKLLNETEKGRVWEQPAAPGMARSLREHPQDASTGE